MLWNANKLELRQEIKELKKDQMEEWELANWKKKANYDDDSLLGTDVVIPNEWVRGMLINAARYTGVVPHFATSKKQTYTRYVESCFVESKGTICKAKDLQPYGAFVGAQGKNSSTKVYRIRPMLKNWEHTFTFVDTEGRMKKEELQNFLDYGGQMIGIGDGRSIRMGRFQLESIKEAKA
jgi:hypothetical protein